VIAGDIVSKHVTESAQYLINKLRGRAYKRSREARGKKKKKAPKSRDIDRIKRAARKIIKMDIFPSFTSVTHQQPIISAAVAEIPSVSSEFDIFAHRHIETSVLGAT